MTRLFLRWILLAVSVFAASLLCHLLNLGFDVNIRGSSGSIDPVMVLKLLIGVAVLSLLNATLGRVLKFLTLPLSCITLGLFSLVVNAIVLLVAASLDLGFSITDKGPKAFLSAIIASLLIAFINGVLGVFLPDKKDD